MSRQSFDSNGPDVRVRGNAWQVYEKYQSLARDAQSAGDRVLAENYLQHAEHYFRITEAIEEVTASEQRQRGYTPAPQPSPSAASFGAQPEVPSNYYSPEGQLLGSQPALPPAPAGAVPAPQPPVKPEARRRVPPPPPPPSTLSPLFGPEEPEDRDSGPQQLVAER